MTAIPCISLQKLPTFTLTAEKQPQPLRDCLVCLSILAKKREAILAEPDAYRELFSRIDRIETDDAAIIRLRHLLHESCPQLFPRQVILKMGNQEKSLPEGCFTEMSPVFAAMRAEGRFKEGQGERIELPSPPDATQKTISTLLKFIDAPRLIALYGDPEEILDCLFFAHQYQLTALYRACVDRLDFLFLREPIENTLEALMPLLQFAFENNEKRLLWFAVVTAWRFPETFKEPLEEDCIPDFQTRARELFDIGIACKEQPLDFYAYQTAHQSSWCVRLQDPKTISDALFTLLQQLDQKLPIQSLNLSVLRENPWTQENTEKLFKSLSGPQTIHLTHFNLFEVKDGSLAIPDHWKASLKELHLSSSRLRGDLVFDLPGLHLSLHESPDLKSITALNAASLTYVKMGWDVYTPSRLERIEAPQATDLRIRGAAQLRELQAPNADRITIDECPELKSIEAQRCYELVIDKPADVHVVS